MPQPARLVRETLLLCILFACVCFPLIWSKKECNYSQDESSFHLPAIRQIAAHWPSLDIANDSLSATAPGYHYFLATVSMVTGQNLIVLRLINWFVSTLTLIVLFVHVRHHLSGLDAMLVLLPLAFSNFFVKSASWIVTDNAALLLTTLCILSCLRKHTHTWQDGGKSLLISLSVFVRQMTIWLVALPLVSAYASPTLERNRRTIHAFLWSAFPLTVLAFLIFRWAGLVPPAWREAAFFFSLTGPIYLLSVFSIFSFFYLPRCADNESRYSTKTRLLVMAASVGLVLSFIQPTLNEHGSGHWGGYLWNLSNYFPDLAGRNMLFIILCTFGTVAVARTWQSLKIRGNNQAAIVFIGGIIAWAATFLVNRQVFHRYFEPTILVFFISLVPALLPNASDLRRWRIGLALCGTAQLGITLATAHLAVWR